MGLSASVLCNCLRESKTTPPPVPAHLIVFDEGYARLDLPWEKHSEEYWQVESWLENCCPHHRMKYFSDIISNWMGYRSFQHALRQIGWQHFPALQAGLPETNDGSMPASAAAIALTELDYFRNHVTEISNWFLADSETGEELRQYAAAYGGVWSVTTGSHNWSFDGDGLFIFTNTKPPCEVFRAKRFEQQIIAGNREMNVVEYTDLDTGQKFTCSAGPAGNMFYAQGRWEYRFPRYGHIQQRNLRADDFSWILSRLNEAFTASAATGNPVYWQ